LRLEAQICPQNFQGRLDLCGRPDSVQSRELHAETLRQLQTTLSTIRKQGCNALHLSRISVLRRGADSNVDWRNIGLGAVRPLVQLASSFPVSKQVVAVAKPQGVPRTGWPSDGKGIL